MINLGAFYIICDYDLCEVLGYWIYVWIYIFHMIAYSDLFLLYLYFGAQNLWSSATLGFCL